MRRTESGVVYATMRIAIPFLLAGDVRIPAFCRLA
jgi:hypothetical protein